MTDKTTNHIIGWNFDNSYARLSKTFYSSLNLNPVKSPQLIILNEALAEKLNLNVQALKSEAGVAVLAGNKIPEGGFPLAQAYAGHQFGHFTMLGDGRAVLLGEHITPSGERVDIQLKGSGRTPYSRGGDGRATLGAMLREYIISEGIHGLGIPTSRSLGVVTTGESVIRETKLSGAILTRVAASHLRVGTFEYAANWATVAELQSLADYTINRHFPEVLVDDNPYLGLLAAVMKVQADLIAKWLLVGFVHGVMNTDNMAISGETIDYGPCAFMDTYDPKTVFSSIDTYGRYAYGNQPQIGGWNLARFAETLLPLINNNQEKAVQLAQDVISDYHEIYNSKWLTGMRAKLGIFNEELQDKNLIEDLLSMMEKYSADYTNNFLALTFAKLDDMEIFNTEEFKKWYDLWQERLNRQSENNSQSRQLMKNSNPALIPRNHRVEEALEAAVEGGDYSIMQALLNALANPYEHTPEQAKYATLPELSCGPYRTFCGT